MAKIRITPSAGKNCSGIPYLSLLLIVLVSVAAYSNSFSVPFHFDGIPNIVNNSSIRDLSTFPGPAGTGRYIPTRAVGYLTFALNYALHGLDVTGYHVVNLLIHIINAVLLNFLVILTFKTPKLEHSALREKSGHIALFAGLLFAAHPMQTQAVTYIVQRFASLAALFCLFSLIMYIKSRTTGDEGTGDGLFRGKKFLYYALSVVSAALAMKTKEIAFTLPVIISVYEFLFLTGKIRRRILYLTPLVLTMLIIPLNIIDINRPAGDVLGDMSEKTRVQPVVSRGDYLLTQFSVVATYIRLLLLPVNQHVDHHYPVSSSFFSPDVFLSFIFLLIIAGSGIYIFCRFRNTAPHSRLVAFGIFWFFVTLSVESSVIPIRDVMFEHRAYLPSAGFFIAACTAVFTVSSRVRDRIKVREPFVYLLAVVVLVMASATFARNNVWKKELTLWKEVTEKSPDNARGHYNLGTIYKKEGRIQDAVHQYETAIRLDPEYAEAYNNLGNIYREKGSLDRAIALYRTAIISYPRYAKAYNNLGAAYAMQGAFQKAEENYLIALKFDPGLAEAYNNLGIIYESRGQLDEAVSQFKKAVELQPSFAEAYNNLGDIYRSKGVVDEAVRLYSEAVRHDPMYVSAVNNIGMAYFDRGDIDTAISFFKDAIRIDPMNADAHYNLGIAYGEKGLAGPAASEMRKGMELRMQ